MLREFSIRRIVVFFLSDWLGTVAMLLVADVFHLQVNNFGQTALYPVANEVFFFVALVWPCFFVPFGIYDAKRNPTLRAELWNITIAIGVSTMALAGLLYFTYRDTSRLTILVFVIFDLVFLLSSRLALWGYRYLQRVQKHPSRRMVLVVGAGQVGQEVVAELRKFSYPNVEVLGFLDDDPEKQGKTISGLPVLGDLDQGAFLVRQYQINHAIVALPLRAHERLVTICQLLQECSVHVFVIPDLFSLSFPSASLGGFGGIPVLDLGLPSIQGWSRLVKRAFDLVIVAIVLILLSPFLLIIAILIKLDSPGSIFYKQQRVGENGRIFLMYKFRSMRQDTDTSLHREHVSRLIQENLTVDQLGNGKTLKMENDPRITRIGQFIRRTSIDELPQLFNIVRGEMSLVGPRPPIPYEVELYQDWHKRRFQAIPGITGLWQVKGRNRVSFDEMVRMDIEYIHEQSLWLDIKILFQTPMAVITGRGAG